MKNMGVGTCVNTVSKSNYIYPMEHIFSKEALHYLREALGNKTLVLYNEPEGRVLRARRARYTSPLGRVVECG